KPRHWLKLATEGVNDGDFVLVAGYPGRTYRYKTADEVRNFKEFVYPTSIRYYGDAMRIMEEAGKNNKDIAIRNSSRVKSSCVKRAPEPYSTKWRASMPSTSAPANVTPSSIGSSASASAVSFAS